MAKVDVKQQMNEELNKFSALRNQYKKIVGMRGQLEIQLTENKVVKNVLLTIGRVTITYLICLCFRN